MFITLALLSLLGLGGRGMMTSKKLRIASSFEFLVRFFQKSAPKNSCAFIKFLPSFFQKSSFS
jgi:hypothetical protein